MNALASLLPLICCLLLAVPVLAADHPPAPLTSSQTDQTGMALTIHNANLGLVKDLRDLTLPSGTGELRFMDVAAQIIPTSVSIRSLSAPAGLRVLEQNYEYDLLNPQKLLDKYVGKEVKLYQKNPNSEREEVVTATLLATSGGPIFRIGNDITFGHPGRIIFPGVPDNLIAQPTLVWLLDNKAAPTQRVEASYLTEGITWRADYVLTLNEKDTAADLAGWVTIDNRSGATYRNAQLKLVAGDVHRVREELYGGRVLKRGAMMAEAAAAPQFKEQEFFDYHIYTLNRPATIKENQTKQLNLTSATAIPIAKQYQYRGAAYYYQSQLADLIRDQKVGVFIEFVNKPEQNLGIPLPKGTVRVYKHDNDGALQFVGEDAIDHTPKNEKVRIKIGEAFDLVATRKQTDWRKVAADTFEAAFEVSLRNHKQEDVVIKVIEPVPGDWQMVTASHVAVKGDAHTAEFTVPVPRNGEAKLVYRVRMRY